MPRNAPPRLRLRAVGEFGTTEMDYPNDREVLETCECPVTVSFTCVPFNFLSVCSPPALDGADERRYLVG